MILEQNNFHKDFKFNNVTFTSVDEILMFSKGFSDEIHYFLEDWFSDKDFINVQTSGSTGNPKPIKLKKEFVVNSALATGKYFSLPEKTRTLLCLPIEYIAGKMMLIRAITLGWRLDVVTSGSNPLENIDKSYDFSAMVPLQVENSIDKLNQIKKLIIGGGVVSNSLQNKLHNISTEVFATYGMTETITHIAVKKMNNFFNVTSSSVEKSFYQALPNVTIYKDDRGCLVIKAPKVSDEIVFTNDIVQLISDTQFEWLGRFDNVINSGGIKLHPEKIEKKLSSIIKERFFVASIPDSILGEKLILIIEGNVTLSAVEKSFKSKINNLELLSKFETPKEIFFVEEFVETDTKKIQRIKTLKKLH